MTVRVDARRPSITGPSRVTRWGKPPVFSVEPGANPYYGIELAASPQLFLDVRRSHRTSLTYYATWQDYGFLTSATFSLPDMAWKRLQRNGRLWYRVWSSAQPDGWVDAEVSTADDEIDEALSFDIGVGRIGERVTRLTGPSITGPSTVVRSDPPPSFDVDPGLNTYYMVEIAGTPELFREEHASERTAETYYATWQDEGFLAFNPYVLPDHAWGTLNSADRLWYRVWTSANDSEWVGTEVSTSDDELEFAPWLDIGAGTAQDEAPSVEDFLAIALTQRGDPYIFGAEASFDDPNPPAFDCSELVQWAASRAGVRFVDGAQNQRDACVRAGTLIALDQGFQTRGALLFRIDEGPGNDHVAISLGDGTTMEARGQAYGVNVFQTAGRSWTHAGTIPGFRVAGVTPIPVTLPAHGERVLRKGDRGEDVRWVQRRLQTHGYDPGPADGVFGDRTEAAVIEFQMTNALEVDGVAGPATVAALEQEP